MSKAVGASPERVDSLVAETLKQYPEDWTELDKERADLL